MTDLPALRKALAKAHLAIRELAAMPNPLTEVTLEIIDGRAEIREDTTGLPAPTAPLCWQQGPLMARCDRREDHIGKHSWEMMAEAERLRELLARCREWPEYAADLNNIPLGATNFRVAVALLADIDAALEADRD